MSWLRVAAVVSACVIAVAGYASLSGNAQQTAQTLDKDQKKMIVDCAAIYRWQGGPDDASYRKLKDVYQTFSGTSPIAADLTLSINRDAFERSVVSGKLTKVSLQNWMDTCADFTTLPPPPGPLRTTAFPEEPKPDSVTGLLNCVVLTRWELGQFSPNLLSAEARYLAYARLTTDDDEDAANDEIKRRVDNIDKALLAGAGSLTDLALAREACQRDFNVEIADIGRQMSEEYEADHPQAPPSALADVDINTVTATIPSAGSSYASNGGGGSSSSSGASVWDGERLYTSGGVDVTDTVSSDTCVKAMNEASVVMQPDLDRLTKAMEFDKKYCTGDFECTYTANGAAVLACGAVSRAKGEIPSQCLKERVILDNLKEKVCPA